MPPIIDCVNQLPELATVEVVVLAGVTGVDPDAPLELTIVDPPGVVVVVVLELGVEVETGVVAAGVGAITPCPYIGELVCDPSDQVYTMPVGLVLV
jgi:hypothetical protein